MIKAQEVRPQCITRLDTFENRIQNTYQVNRTTYFGGIVLICFNVLRYINLCFLNWPRWCHGKCWQLTHSGNAGDYLDWEMMAEAVHRNMTYRPVSHTEVRIVGFEQSILDESIASWSWRSCSVELHPLFTAGSEDDIKWYYTSYKLYSVKRRYFYVIVWSRWLHLALQASCRTASPSSSRCHAVRPFTLASSIAITSRKSVRCRGFERYRKTFVCPQAAQMVCGIPICLKIGQFAI